MIHRTRNRLITLLIICMVCIAAASAAAEKNAVTIKKIDNLTAQDIRVRTSFSSGAECEVRHDGGVTWQINGWIVGNELYKSFLDPSLSCLDPYPFDVYEINMPMIFTDTTTMIVSVDVEQVDYSDPSCPFPDTVMLGISSAYEITIPEAGFYNIWIPLDNPITVNGPFFAGFFIGDITNPNSSPSPVTDNDSTSICESYNVWDDTLGFIDLMDNQFYNFPGQLVLYAKGMTGGTSLDPEPQITILSPKNNSHPFANLEFWAEETSGSGSIDYVSFSYSLDTNYTEIGRDYDGTKTFRDGQSQVLSGNGYSLDWDFSTLPIGTYNIKVTAVDTLGRSGSDFLTLDLKPTPPVVEITSPSVDAAFCPEFDILMSSSDQNLFAVNLGYKRSNPEFSINAQTLLMSDFGDYYSSAIAASLAFQAIQDRGGYNIMRINYAPATTSQMVNELASNYFFLSEQSGVFDEDLFSGLIAFNQTIANVLDISYLRNPKYIDLRREIELLGKVGLIGLGGSSNNWVLLDGFHGIKANDDTYQLTVSNPFNSNIDTVQFRNTVTGSELYFNGGWQPVEMIILLGTAGWNSDVTNFGGDVNKNDGWSYHWNPPNLWQGYDYFIQAKGTELTGLVGYYTTMLHYDCTQFYLAGDFDNDGLTDLNDLDLLIQYFTAQGPPPVGGDARADTNCDHYLNITDIIYYINFLFGSASAPCY